jgi:hypothetical protein
MRVQLAWAASRKKCRYLRALFTRLTVRCGLRKAAVVTAILTIVSSLLTRRVLYANLGAG